MLHYAVSRKSALEMIPYLISHGANINEKGWDNETPLFAAASYFNEMRSFQSKHPSAWKVIELLATLGADLNAVDDYGNTILMQCTVADNTELVKLLLELGADTERKNNGGKTARDIAYDLGHRYLYQILH